jgi:hypothetical protein
VSLARQRTLKRSYNQLASAGARFGVLGSPDSTNIARVLLEHVLETASSSH